MIDDTIRLLKERQVTLAVAESCTGGRLAAAFTAAAGASEFFLGGVVAYSNDIKTNVLGVSPETIEHHGAVSREVARQMAVGVMRLTGASFAIATTGIAGPGGGTPDKPVGTVWIAVARSVSHTDGISTEVTTEDTAAQCFHFTGTRAANMSSATAAAIEMLHQSFL